MLFISTSRLTFFPAFFFLLPMKHRFFRIIPNLHKQMLQKLYIQNYAIIDELEIDFFKKPECHYR